MDASESATPSTQTAEPTHRPSRRPCPQCGAKRVYRSHRRSFAERILGLAGMKIRRCHACGLRYTRLGGSVLLMADVKRLLRRLALVALMIGGLGLILAAVIFYGAWRASLGEAGLLIVVR
jgi:predicted RNA-binding Zn-ribbon protein involved in translation (DUF1610 family)